MPLRLLIVCVVLHVCVCWYCLPVVAVACRWLLLLLGVRCLLLFGVVVLLLGVGGCYVFVVVFINCCLLVPVLAAVVRC